MANAEPEILLACKEAGPYLEGIEPMQGAPTKLLAVTKEKDDLEVEYSPAGWKVIRSDATDPLRTEKVSEFTGSTFETFHALFSNISPEFHRLWSEHLQSRLAELTS